MRKLIFGEYSVEEKEQMRAIHHYFLQDIGDVSDKLAMNDAFSRPKSTAALHYSELTSTRILGAST